MALFAEAGEVSRLDVADMRLQVAERDSRVAAGPEPAPANGSHASAPGLGERTSAAGAEAALRCGAVAVANGDGVRELFAELGVLTVDGGATMNPSTYDLLAGVHAVPAEEVVLMPNSPNVIMAAQHAAQLSDKAVLVAPTTSQQAGLVAALALAPDRSVEENAHAISAALAPVRTGAVAPAARDDAQGRFKRGDAVGFIQDEVLAWGDAEQTLRAVMAELARPGDTGQPPELISVLAGEEAPLSLGDLEQMANGAVELELRHGGQSAYWWLLAAE